MPPVAISSSGERRPGLVAEEGTRRPATSLLVRVDPARGVASLASAGHLPPVVFCGDGTGELVDLPVGPPLGTGVGGGLNLVPGGSATIDDTTITGNHASTTDNDVHGTFST